MIRFLALNAFIALDTVLFSLWGVVLSLFDKDGRLAHFYVAVPWARSVLWACGVKIEVKGLEHVDKHVPRIYMSNHQSYFDIFALLACLPAGFKFILKQELMKIPLFGTAIRKAGYIPIDRKDPRKAIKSMNEAAEKIKGGASVLIFPEGTRSPDGRLQPFRPGGFHLALRSGCDIMPVVIVGSRRIVPKGSLRIEKGSFVMCIGEAIPTKDCTRKDMDQLMSRVREAMEKETRMCEP
ncbi:MAG: 1-acyl-sn-glycerol-3-phosphate acyltransferase [Desulfobacterales bacterium]|nr:1-acyl-sn-glycerol-3-phosphate acyltransferase [Desulfobacterales bacterium]